MPLCDLDALETGIDLTDTIPFLGVYEQKLFCSLSMRCLHFILFTLFKFDIIYSDMLFVEAAERWMPSAPLAVHRPSRSLPPLHLELHHVEEASLEL